MRGVCFKCLIEVEATWGLFGQFNLLFTLAKRPQT